MSRSPRFWLTCAVVLLVGAAAVAVYLGARREESRAGGFHLAGSDAGYVDPKMCQPCHSQIFSSYQQNGMGRSFYRLDPTRAAEDWRQRNRFYHAPSDRYYTMYERGGRYFQRRHQIGHDGNETNVLEREVHFVLGSGNHTRAYLHRTADGRLLQLPVGWYAEKGGFWAMSPGYDRPVHHDFRRRIRYECIFCHNGYPQIESGADLYGREPLFRGALPEGIDCQRCHGPALEHIRLAGSGDSTAAAIRSSIVNPALLDARGQLEVCLQCHLESTSARLPPYLRRFGRGVFSYRAGEPLSDYILHFDHAPGTGYDEKFEIASAPYRLQMSACFAASGGRLTCTTCHDPHDIPRGEAAARHYAKVCERCHSPALDALVAANRHTAATDCAGCHMPKRRTDDVVHVVMTDHRIQRRNANGDPIAPRAEESFYGRTYGGEVVPYYPREPASRGDADLYLAMAQVAGGSNLKRGIEDLNRALAKQRPEESGFYYELAKACAADGQLERAVAAYEQALARRPDLWPAREGLGVALLRLANYPRAATELERAAALAIEEATTLSDLALAYRNLGRLDDAQAALERAIRADPDLPEAHNNLGGLLLERGDEQAAEAAFRNAIRLQPDFAAAHHSLAKLLVARSSFAEAGFHFEQTIRHKPDLARARRDYARMLVHLERYDRAQAELEAAARFEPRSADSHNALGEVLALRGAPREAVREFRRALELDPNHHQANFNMGNALLVERKLEQALLHLGKAAESQDPELRQQALETMRRVSASRTR